MKGAEKGGKSGRNTWYVRIRDTCLIYDLADRVCFPPSVGMRMTDFRVLVVVGEPLFARTLFPVNLLGREKFLKIGSLHNNLSILRFLLSILNLCLKDFDLLWKLSKFFPPSGGQVVPEHTETRSALIC